MTTEYKAGKATLKTGSAGTVTAMFCRLNVVDADDDIVKASAFTDGQEVPLAWAHEWTKIVGKGTIRISGDGVYFDGKFFIDTDAGKEAYKTVKAMAELMQWSFGFQVLKSSYVNVDGKTVRQIEKAEIFEVSPVLKGAGVGTYTAAIKQGSPLSQSLPESTRRELADIRHGLSRSGLGQLAKYARVLGLRDLSQQTLQNFYEFVASMAVAWPGIDDRFGRVANWLLGERPGTAVDLSSWINLVFMRISTEEGAIPPMTHPDVVAARDLWSLYEAYLGESNIQPLEGAE